MSALKALTEALGRPPVTQKLGNIIIEPNIDGFLMMFPDGCIELAISKEIAERKANRWFKKHATGDIGVGTVEWR